MPAKTQKSSAKATSKEKSLFAGRYELLRKAGQGGGGTVFLAKDLRARREVALKILDLKKSKDPFLAQALENEFAALTLLKHRHLAKVLDYGKTDSEIYLSSEWIDGEDLLSASLGADLNSVFRFVVQLLRAVDFLHRRGVLHLDLKPENILIARSAGGEINLRLIDFGLAEWQRHGVRGPGEFSGTPPYAAPELLQERPAGPYSDTYSIGMLLHRIFSEGFPFASQDPLKMIQAQLSAAPLRALNLNAALPDSFGDLLLKSVAKDPKQRFQSPAELLAAINASLEENFSLRDSQAPAAILEESDHGFRPDLEEALFQGLQSNSNLRLAIIGERGLGKTRLLTRLKEKLQIAGGHPLFFSDLATYKKGVEGRENREPLLLDFDALSAASALELSRMSSVHRGPALLALPATSSLPEGFTRETLASLTEKEVVEFLQNEIREFPGREAAAEISLQSRGRLDLLETALQALREEGLLQWSENGWRWFGKEDEPPQDLMPRHEARWEERRLQTEEWLKVSPLGLSAELLAGLLGVDSDTLEPWLSRWVASGVLQPHLDSETVLYSLRSEAANQAGPHSRDWELLQTDLEAHYAKGEFALGVRMIERLNQDLSPETNLPDEVRVHGARLLAAVGRNEQALAFLPKVTPNAPPLAGLYWEVVARVHATLGELNEAQRALELAESAYRTMANLSGTSRVHNLRGWTLKKRGQASEALESFVKAEAAAKSAGDDYAQGLAEMNRGTVYHDQGRLEKAQDCYAEALSSAERARHPLLQLKLIQNQVNLLYTMGRSADAESLCYRLLRLAIQQRDVEARAGALNFLSLFAGQQGDLEHQKLYLNQAIESLSSGSSPLLPQLYFNRAHLHWDQRRSTAAQIDTEAALAASERAANPFVAAWSKLLLGKILRDRAKPDLSGAQGYLESAREEMSRHQLGHLLWEVEFDLGLLAKKLGDGERARSHFETAKEELKKLLPELPENLRQSYLRDRKLEKIEDEMKSPSP